MVDTQHLANLIEQLAEITPNQKLTNKAISKKIIAVGGSWHLIGTPEGRHYIDALNLDTDGRLFKKVIRAYMALRQNFTQHIRENPKDYKFYLDDGYFLFMGLIHNCGELAVFALSEIKNMLYSDDSEIEWSGCLALKGAGLKAIQLLPDIFNLMQKRGLNEQPYKIGEILVQLSKSFPEVCEGLKLNLSSDSENLLHSTLFTCYLMEEKSDYFYEDLKRLAKSKTGETKSLAILALGSTGRKDDDLCELLLENTTSTEWYIRGNAITTIGRLQLSPERVLPIIINALHDDEGHDWTVQECAIKALGNYTDFAAIYKESVVPVLRDIRKRLKEEQNQDWVSQIKEVNVVLTKFKICNDMDLT